MLGYHPNDGDIKQRKTLKVIYARSSFMTHFFSFLNTSGISICAPMVADSPTFFSLIEFSTCLYLFLWIYVLWFAYKYYFINVVIDNQLFHHRISWLWRPFNFTITLLGVYLKYRHWLSLVLFLHSTIDIRNLRIGLNNTTITNHKQLGLML